MVEEERVERGRQLKALLDDPLLLETLERLEKKYMEEIKTASDFERAEKPWYRLQVLGDVRREIQAGIDDGSMAASSLKAHARAEAQKKPPTR